MHPVRVAPFHSPAATNGGGGPQKPVPFDMTEWRRRWGEWWSRANREAINAAMRKVG